MVYIVTTTTCLTTATDAWGHPWPRRDVSHPDAISNNNNNNIIINNNNNDNK